MHKSKVTSGHDLSTRHRFGWTIRRLSVDSAQTDIYGEPTVVFLRPD